MAEFPCAWMWRRRNPAAGTGSRARILTPYFPSKIYRNLPKNPVNLSIFIEFSRNSLCPERIDRRRHHTAVPRTRADRNCGKMRGRAPVEDEAGLPGAGSPQSGPTPQVTPERLVSRYRNCGEMRLPRRAREPADSRGSHRLRHPKTGGRRAASPAYPACAKNPRRELRGNAAPNAGEESGSIPTGEGFLKKPTEGARRISLPP